MNFFGSEVAKFRNPAPDVVTVGIKSLTLPGRIEDSKIRLGITSS